MLFKNGPKVHSDIYHVGNHLSGLDRFKIREKARKMVSPGLRGRKKIQNSRSAMGGLCGRL